MVGANVGDPLIKCKNKEAVVMRPMTGIGRGPT